MQKNTATQSLAASYRAIAAGLRSSDRHLAQRSLTDLICHLHPKLGAWLRKKGITDDNNINDVLQATWLKVWHSRSEIDPTKFCQAWVFRICLNVIIDSSQKKKNRLEVNLGDADDLSFTSGPSGAAFDPNSSRSRTKRTREQAVLAEISKWSAIDQNIIWTWVNADGEDWTAEISRDSGKKPATLRKRLFNLKERLQKALSQLDPVGGFAAVGSGHLPSSESMGVPHDAEGRHDNHG